MVNADAYAYGQHMPVMCALCGRTFAGIKQHSFKRGCRGCSVARASCELDHVVIVVESHSERCAITLHERAMRNEDE